MSMKNSALGRQLVERGFLLPEHLEGLPAGSALEPGDFLLKLAMSGHLTKFQVKAISRGQIDTLCFGPYVILDMVGRGGMSAIFRARHRHMQRLIALKVISPEIEKDPIAVQRFWREVRVIAQLDHPHVVKAYDAGEESGKMYLAMELIQGMNCGDLVKGKGPLKFSQALNLIGQAASGLAYAHAAGIVHRDVKPSNLFINEKGIVKVLDLGLALMQVGPSDKGPGADRTDLTRSGVVMGTVDYIAPEQARGKRNLDGRADIYSLGCTLYFLLTGQRPYSGENIIDVLLAHMNSPVPNLAAAGVECPPGVQDLLNGMMEKESEKRIGTMDLVINAISAIRSQSSAAGKASGIHSPKGSAPQIEPLVLAPAAPLHGVRNSAKKGSGTAEQIPGAPEKPKSDSIPSFMEVPTLSEGVASAPPSRLRTLSIVASVLLLALAFSGLVYFQPWRSPAESSVSAPAADAPTTGVVDLELAGELAGIELAVDGTAHTVAQTSTLSLDPGRHEIIARRRGQLVKQHIINLKAGQRLAVVLDLRASGDSVQNLKVR